MLANAKGLQQQQAEEADAAHAEGERESVTA